MEFLLHHQWIAYAPGLALLAVGLLRLFAGAGRSKDDAPREEDHEPRIMVAQRVPSVFDRKDRKSGK